MTIAQVLCINNAFKTRLLTAPCLLGESVEQMLTWCSVLARFSDSPDLPDGDATGSSGLQNHDCNSFPQHTTCPSTQHGLFLYLACHCHPQGSKTTVCDQITGQCSCQGEVAGRRCDRCLQGYFGFPSCRPCLCNGFAELCDPETGSCFNCGGFTTGRNCERYGIPMHLNFISFVPMSQHSLKDH